MAQAGRQHPPPRHLRGRHAMTQQSGGGVWASARPPVPDTLPPGGADQLLFGECYVDVLES